MAVRFISTEPRVLVRKAAPRRPWKRTRTFTRLNRLAAAKRNAIVIGFKSGISKIKSKVDPEAVYRAWLSGDYAKLYETIPWSDMPEDIAGYSDAIGSALTESGEAVIRLLPPQVRKSLRWDTSNQAIQRYVDAKTGELIQDITQSTQSHIASIIARSHDTGLTARKVSEMIRPSIGLGTRLATAHANYVDGLRATGMSESRIGKLSGQYEDRLLDYRSLMIARTESSFARNAGQLSVWNSAADQGLIDRQTTMKQWVTDGDPCPECVDLEDAGPIPIDEDWEGGVDAPPLHPNCECGMDLVFGDEPVDAEQPEE